MDFFAFNVCFSVHVDILISLTLVFDYVGD